MESALDSTRMRRLMEVAPDLVSELDLETVLERVLRVARELTGAKYAALGVLDEERQGLERFLTVGIDEAERGEIGDPPRGRGVLGVLIDHPVPLRLPDVGRHPRSYGFPPGHPAMKTFLGVPVLIRGQAWGNLYLTEKDEGDFTDADEQAIVTLASWAGIAIENARLYRRERERRSELERAVRAMEATTDIARAIGGETELERVLELIVKRGRALVDARTMAIGLRVQDKIEIRAAAGHVGPELIGATYPTEGSVGGFVLRGKRSQRLSDVSAQLHFALAPYTDAKAGLVVPLLFRGRGLGVLYALDRLERGPEFGPDDERLLEAFAASAATAVATAQEFAAHGLRRSMEASEQERRRWARELHDQTLQDLGALRVSLSTARRVADPELLRAAVDDAIERLGSGIDELRTIITDLRPAALDELGMRPALEALVERTATISGLDVELRYDAAPDGSRHASAIENTVYRLTQEAVTNAAKHAAASRVDIAVSERDGEIEIRVADDGKGFDPERNEGGFGLIGMRERVGLLNGTLEIASEPGAGTTVRAVLPAARVEQAPRVASA